MKYIYIIIGIIALFVIYNYNFIIEKYDNQALSKMKQYNVIFCSTIRNVSPYIENALKNVEKCGSKFNKYSVVLYENDSNDNTRELLEKNKKDNYHYVFENNITEKRRTVRIANGRNKILDKIYEININNEYQYMIMLDLDDVNKSGKFVDSIESCFTYPEDKWDVFTGNQIDRYYDLWALRKKGDMEYDCWQMINKHGDNDSNRHKYVYSKYKVYPQGKLLEVDSAFGGVAIYKLSSISNCRYVGNHPDDSEKCEHVEFNECIKRNGGKIFINTSFLTN